MARRHDAIRAASLGRMARSPTVRARYIACFDHSKEAAMKRIMFAGILAALALPAAAWAQAAGGFGGTGSDSGSYSGVQPSTPGTTPSTPPAPPIGNVPS